MFLKMEQVVVKFYRCAYSDPMIIVGFDLVVALVAREKRTRPNLAKALERRTEAWRAEVEQVRWKKPTEVKAMYGTADVIGGSRVVFDICGNNYRLVVQFNYATGVARIRFAGNHADYDRIDAIEV